MYGRPIGDRALFATVPALVFSVVTVAAHSQGFSGRAAAAAPAPITPFLMAADAPSAPGPSAGPGGGKPLRLTIEGAIEAALKHNLALEVSRLDRDALEPDIPSAKAAFDPVVGVTGTRSFDKTVDIGSAPSTRTHRGVVTAFVIQPMTTGGSVVLATDLTRDDTEGQSRQWEGNYSISLVQPLMRGGRVYVARRGISDAEFNLKIENAKLRAQAITVAAETKTAYYNMVLASNLIGVTQAAINRSETLLESSKALMEAKIVTVRDVLKAHVNLSQDREKLVSAQSDLLTASNNLLDILGYSHETRIELADTTVGFKRVELDVDKLIATAFARRPELMQLDEQLAQSRLNIRVAENSVLPQVDLVSTYSRNQIGSAPAKVLQPDGNGWSLGLVFSVPIGNVAAQSALSKAKIQHSSLRRQRVQQERAIELAVRNAVVKLNRSLARRTTLLDVVEQARQLEAVAKARFTRGLATNEDISNAQVDIRDAETDLLSATVDYNIGLAELEAATAGPIESTPNGGG